ncbi:biotin--[acetyl-CoA-carboxylase] ligase [uncultured Oscillibacter sp.]|uniref:biotin--[acetyl-CoA-carboxylase] ligase n=1 Tax=uncultured Oscillibacter sp. TaxID=876091 RepID=UPI0025F68C44|nr:biotin--[acetyl-CoA-carboxylase] ligase [uncultured Oscillibacter sp.]
MSREAVLALLRAGGETYLSGEELSRQLGLSRAAVWKAVDALRREGYVVEARTGLGYRLVTAPDAMTEAEIRNFLGKTAVVGRTLKCFNELDSTNIRAKQLALEGAPDGTVVTADCQSAGRGRMDRSFQSPKGKGVYLTVLLRPHLPPERLLPVTAMAGVAVCDAVEELCGVRPGLKWPNDPVLGGKKLCGILTELSLEGETGRVQYLVLGIGVNVLHVAEDFSPEVAEMATSLSLALGHPVSRPALAAAEIRALDRLYASLLAGDLTPYLAAYRRSCVNLGRTVQLISPDGSRETAQALDVDEDFSLVVRTASGAVKTVRSGEVSVRGMYGYTE